MSTRHSFRGLLACLSVAAACLLSTGCNPFTAIYFLLLLPEPKVKPKYEGLEKQTVAVVAFAGNTAKNDYVNVDNDLAKGVVRELRDNVKKIKLADPAEVRRWRDKHPNFELSEAGKEFQATRVVYLELEAFTLYDVQSSTLFQGSARVHVQVADIEKDGDIVWEDHIELQYPSNRPIPASDISREKFRTVFIKYLTRQVAHCFFEYRPDEDFTIN